MKSEQVGAHSHSGKRALLCFGLVLILALGVIAWWSQVVGKAQTESVKQAQSSSNLKVLVETTSGNIVTSSQGPAAVQTISYLNSLLQKYPGTWNVDIEKGVVKNLKPTTPIAVTSSPKDFSLSLLSEFSNLFGIGSEETAYVMEFNFSQRRLVEFRQVIDGIPVEDTFMTFSAENSKLEQVTSRVYPELSRKLNSVRPSLTKQAAFDIAASDFNDNLRATGSLKISYKGDLVVLPEANAYFLTWKVLVDATGSLDSYTYYIDANTGRVIKKHTNVSSQKSLNPAQDHTTLRSKEAASAVLRTKMPTAEERGRTDNESGEKAESKAADTYSTQSVPLQQSGAWQTILSENFDTLSFPYSPWRAFDDNGFEGGELYWDDQNCVSHDPSWSLWAADGGTNGLNACTENYANNMNSWVIYGPFDLSNSNDGLLEFHYNNVSELNYDHFKWMASVDGTHFSGYQVSGNSDGWQYQSLDLKNVPTLGNLTGRSQVWIAFIFSTDSSVVSGKGAFVDDVAIKKRLSTSCTGVSGHVGGHIYGKNQYDLQLKDFKDMKVVLNNSFATDSHTVTNSTGNYSSSECSDYIRFELEGYGTSNFLKVRDCNDGTCPFGGDLLTSQDFSFASQVSFDWNVDAENKKEVNVFWHVNEMHDWYRSLLGQDLMDYQMQAYVDYDDSICPNAFYRSTDKNIYFCPSVDYARESDVIYHEYTHGIVDHIPNYTLSGPDERGAMSEGIADYYAAAKNNDPEIGEGVGTIRNITKVINYNSRCYPEVSTCNPGQYQLRSSEPQRSNDFGFIHYNSLVPSGSLWNLRQNQSLSGSYVDKLVFDTLILRKPLTFSELLNGLVAQDGGLHEAQIRAAFATRGVTNSSCTYSLDPVNRIFLASASTGSFTVSTSGNCSWTANSNVSWLTTNSSGTGSGTVNYSVAANSGNTRSGTISVGGQSFTVFQSAGNGNGCPTRNISIGETINTTLTTGCVFTGTSRYIDPYNFTGTMGQQIVIAMSSTAFDTYLFLDGPNNQTLAQDDDGGGARNSRIPASGGAFTLPTSGTYRIWATSFSPDGTTGSTGPYTISLLSGTSCTYSINQNSQNVAATASNNSFSILTQAGCSWTALSNASWITTSSSGSGNGTINYSVAANTGAVRSGTISVGGQLFTVNQAGAQMYSVTLSAAPVAGGTVSGGGTFLGGTSRTVAATANSGYTFANWAENGSIVSFSPNYTFTLNSHRNLVGNFTLNPVDYLITVSASPSAGGTVSGGGIFGGGTSRTVSATANSGYSFTNWSENGGIVSVSPGYTFTLNSNRNLIANFMSTGIWSNVVGVSVSGVSENTLTKIAPDGWGNAGARSIATINSGDGYVEFTATETNKDRMAGLGTGDSNQNYSDIEYAVDLTPGGAAWVFESGVGRGVYTLYQGGDVFRIGVEGGVVKYRKNGTLFYTSSVVPVYPLLLDTSLYTTGATVTNALVVSGGNSPTVTTTAATPIATTSATLNGSVNPNGLATTAWFEWGTDPTLTSNTQTSAQAIGSGTGSQAISANLSGLTATTIYYFRAVASNSAGQTKGTPIRNFLTGPFTDQFWGNLVGVNPLGNSLVKTGPDGWGNGGARSIATINSGDGYVEFTATETNKDRMAGLGNGDSSQHYSDIEYAVDLTPGGIAWVFESGVGRGAYALYQGGDVFRVGVEGGVVKYRKNGTLFYTSSVVPVYPLLLDTSLYSAGATITNALVSGGNSPTVTTTAATSMTTTSATLNGSANPNGLTTTAWFEWGTDPTLTSNTQTSAQAIGSGTSSQAISANLSGLTINTTYYFRAVASNSAGQTKGTPIQSFLTTTDLFWTNTVGVAASPSVNSLIKTVSDGWGNGGARSIATIASGDGYVEFTATETNKDRMAGLGTGDSSQNYSDIEYAVDLTPGGIAWVFESGVGRGAYTLYQGGDVFRIGVEGGVVKYRKNGTLFYTSSVVPVYPLLLDTSLYSTGATITNAVVSGGGGGPTPIAPTVTTNAATSITATSATLNGSVNPNGLATTAWFEWGTDPTLTSNTQTSAQAIGSGTTSQSISANLSGLTTNTTYYFRAVGSNSAGQNRDSTLSFSFSGGGPTTESVVWTEALGVLVSGNNLTKTAADGWGNAGASSTKGIASGDGYIECTVTETNKDRMCGLSNGDTNKEYADIDYAIDLTVGGVAWVFESGVGRGVYTTYQAGDVFRIAVEGGVVRYRKNGTLFYTSNVTPVYPLLLDTSLHSTGATITNAVISGNLQSLVPTLESVIWTNVVGANAAGNSLTKTLADGWGNAGAVSSRVIPAGDGYVQFTATETNRDRMAGLSKGDSSQHYSDIDYAIDLTPGGTAWVFESGVNRGVYTLFQAGDVFRIAAEGGVVKYSKNGSVFYTSSVAPAYPLLLDTSLNSTGATVTNALIFGKF